MARKPARAYICGAHDPKNKVHLVIEVSEKMTPNFENTIDRIYLALKKDNLTKQEARDMRAALLGWKLKALAPRDRDVKLLPLVIGAFF